eukprot:TRINITY_DN31528_c0_g1_i1.p1 TRINITY_DN31528_c0_g1~~TRINITY_DN31528_c0_g1_i1.p1  ORF type:complete len:554 (-),score=73.66 TRINITY_DN31528_c0_g1_i1:35-1672(-)
MATSIADDAALATVSMSRIRLGEPDLPTGVRVIPRQEAERVRNLPNLHARIDELGLTQEYAAFRDRFLGWRKGEAKGAQGEASTLGQSRNGFGYYYPSMEVWQWRRTLSYWISVTFFEGSIFFTISSFMYCYEEELGKQKEAMTLWGYVGGKICFIVCTYLMCIETINLTPSQCEQRSAERRKSESTQRRRVSITDEDEMERARTRIDSDYSCSSGSDDDTDSSDDDERRVRSKADEIFFYNPFRYKKAIANLKEVGAGPWPYIASIIYFIGVGAFTIGLAAEFSPIPKEVEHWTLLISFLIGSFLFWIGGVAECVENGVFTSLSIHDQGWWGALLNMVGGLGFFIGALLGFEPSLSYESNFWYGIGSVIFAAGSGIQIVMWKDEQFGLTFLAVLNHLGGPSGRPMVLTPGGNMQEEQTFSRTGTLFIMIHCFSSALSFYASAMLMHSVKHNTNLTMVRWITMSIDALIPCILAHIMLVLNSAVIKTPTMAPFRQLYIGARVLAACMVLNSGGMIIGGLMDANWHVHHPEEPSSCLNGTLYLVSD